MRGVKRRFDKKWREASLQETPEAVRHLGLCWVWTGAKSGPYGTMRIQGSNYPVHRISVAIYHDDWTDPDLVVDHLCMNKLCVAPHHLEPVTYVVNAQRYLVRPDDPGTRVLTTARALQLQLDLRKAKEADVAPDYEALGEKYGVTGKHIRKIELERYWEHAETEDDAVPDIRQMRYDVLRYVNDPDYGTGPVVNSCDGPASDLGQLEPEWNTRTDDEIVNELMRRWASGEAPIP